MPPLKKTYPSKLVKSVQKSGKKKDWSRPIVLRYKNSFILILDCKKNNELTSYPLVNICYNLKLENIWLAETRPCWGVYRMRLRIKVVSNVNFRHWQGFPMDKNENICSHERHLRKLERRFISRIRTTDNGPKFSLARKCKWENTISLISFFNLHFASMRAKIRTLYIPIML